MTFDEQIDDLKDDRRRFSHRELAILDDMQSMNTYMDRMSRRDGWIALFWVCAIPLCLVAVDYWPIFGRLL